MVKTVFKQSLFLFFFCLPDLALPLWEARRDGGIEMEREEKMINARVVKKDDKVEIIIDDYEFVGYLYDWAEEWEVEFDTDNPNKPLLVIKFFVRER